MANFENTQEAHCSHPCIDRDHERKSIDIIKSTQRKRRKFKQDTHRHFVYKTAISLASNSSKVLRKTQNTAGGNHTNTCAMAHLYFLTYFLYTHSTDQQRLLLTRSTSCNSLCKNGWPFWWKKWSCSFKNTLGKLGTDDWWSIYRSQCTERD